MKLVSQMHGRTVFEFDWKAAGGAEPFPAMARANWAAREAADAAQAKLETLSNDANFTQQGRLNEMKKWFDASGLSALKQGREAHEAAAAAIGRIRAGMKPKGADPTDMAGAMVRQEIRTWFRGLEPEARAARLSEVEEMDPQLALAISEAPAELSGVTPEQKSRAASRGLLAAYPKEAEQIQKIEEATDALMSTLRMTSLTMQKATGYSPGEIERAMGGDNKITAQLDIEAA